MPSILFSHVQIKEQAHVSRAWWMVAAHKSSRAEWQKCNAAVSLAAAGALEPSLKPVPWEALVSDLQRVSSGCTVLGEWVPLCYTSLFSLKSDPISVPLTVVNRNWVFSWGIGWHCLFGISFDYIQFINIKKIPESWLWLGFVQVFLKIILKCQYFSCFKTSWSFIPELEYL